MPQLLTNGSTILRWTQATLIITCMCIVESAPVHGTISIQCTWFSWKMFGVISDRPELYALVTKN